MKWVQVVDKVDEINTLNEIRIRLSNEFEPLKETNLYTTCTHFIKISYTYTNSFNISSSINF